MVDGVTSTETEENLDIQLLCVIDNHFISESSFQAVLQKGKVYIFLEFLTSRVFCRFYTYTTLDFTQVMFRLRYPVTWASLGTRSILTSHMKKTDVYR